MTHATLLQVDQLVKRFGGLLATDHAPHTEADKAAMQQALDAYCDALIAFASPAGT